MCSFDVESLFTNIPTLKTIEIILNRTFEERNESFHGLTRDQLKKLLIICTQESHFKFNGKYYDQIDGVSMGSPLGPLMANIFMANFEKENMANLKELGVSLWFRYVDDVFASTKNGDTSKILEYLNKQHPNIKFTIEKEEKNQLPFLDTLVTRQVNRYTTSIYRKKTFTGVYLNWKSLTSRKYKIGLINSLIDRVWKICTLPEERDIELKKIKSILTRNDYP